MFNVPFQTLNTLKDIQSNVNLCLISTYIYKCMHMYALNVTYYGYKIRKYYFLPKEELLTIKIIFIAVQLY